MDRVAQGLAWHQWLKTGVGHAEHGLLLAMRLYWGWQFFATGRGKLENIERVIKWFGEDLHIPMPGVNAYMAAGTEMIGGLLLLSGFLSRPAAFALAFTMCVAYATSDREALVNLFANPDGFVTAAPFLFLLTCVWVLVRGPGWISIDGGIVAGLRYWKGWPVGQVPK